MNLYAYCLADEAEPTPALDHIVGVAQESPGLIGYKGIAAVVSSITGASISVTRDSVLLHEKVIGRVLARTTPLPFRFGMVVSEQRLAEYVESNRAALISGLDRVRGSVEMSVKVMLAASADEPAREEREERESLGVGAKFLARKRVELGLSAMISEREREITEWLGEQVKDLIRETSVRNLPTATHIVAVSHLVDRSRLDEYRERLKSLRERKADLRFLTSGPWPPYSFCDLSA
jgi:hypothetical protein